ncbi:50S ribosomal protein L13 [Candidatus Sumerlaeota bacterium]|nr:50S ribosomal protein L13 [Candidatus Sumerlaeota bacterium]
MRTTFSPKKESFEEKWYIVDAKDQILGRLATRIASVLRGKHLPVFAPHLSPRTHIIVINAEKIKMTGNKWTDKIYYWHTGYPSGLKSASATKMLKTKPEEIIRRAVWGMIPKNRLGHATMKRLRIYVGQEHPHKAQKPHSLKLETRKAREE